MIVREWFETNKLSHYQRLTHFESLKAILLQRKQRETMTQVENDFSYDFPYRIFHGDSTKSFKLENYFSILSF